MFSYQLSDYPFLKKSLNMPKCCNDPLRKHKKKIYTNLRKISNHLYEMCNNKLDKETYLCSNCRKMILRDPSCLDEIYEDLHRSFESIPEDVTSTASNSNSSSEYDDPLNMPMILKELNVTPLKTRKYLL